MQRPIPPFAGAARRVGGVIAAAALVLVAVPAAPAGATTSGGHVIGVPSDPVLIGDTAVQGVASEEQTEWMAPITHEMSLRGLALPDPFSRPVRPGVSVAAAGLAPLALAGGRDAGAVAWLRVDGLASALVSARTLALADTTTHAVAGPVRAAAVAAPAGTGHVLAWTDDGGLHARWVAPGGSAGSTLAVATGTVSTFSLTAASDGRAWLVWRDDGELRALLLAPDGSAERADGGSAPGGWQQRAGPDGELWLLARGDPGATLRRLTPAGAEDVAFLPGPRRRAFVDVAGSTVLVATSGLRPGRIVLHRFGATHGRRTFALGARARLAGLAAGPDGRASLLLGRSDGVALLTPGAGQRLLARGARPGAVAAGRGVVAATTSRVHHEEEHEDGGGSAPQTMRYERLHLLAGGRTVRGAAVLDGRDDF